MKKVIAGSILYGGCIVFLTFIIANILITINLSKVLMIILAVVLVFSGSIFVYPIIDFWMNKIFGKKY